MKLVIFGASERCQNRVDNFINLKDNEIVVYFDNDKSLQNSKTQNGNLIDLPENIINYDYDYILIMAIATNANEIKEQLLSFGISSSKILFFTNVFLLDAVNDKYVKVNFFHTTDINNVEVVDLVKPEHKSILESNKNEFYKMVNKYLIDLKKYDDIAFKVVEKLKTENEITIDGIRVLNTFLPQQELLFLSEFLDLLLPYYLKSEQTQRQTYFIEGPYEDFGVTLEENDVVVDCGANMGFFLLLLQQNAQKEKFTRLNQLLKLERF